MKNPLLLPFWFLALATGAKSFRDNPIIGSKRLNKAGLHMLRVRLAHNMAARRRRKLARHVPAIYREQFATNGFLLIPDFLDKAEFTALRDKIYELAAPAREMTQGDTITRRIAINPDYLKSVPALGKAINNPKWRGLMHYVASFATEPLYYIQTIIKEDRGTEVDPQTKLHADTFHPTMKAWFFLHDVPEDKGPFCYVPGSHRATEKRLAWEKARSIAAPDGVDFLSSRGSMRIEEAELSNLGLPPVKKFAVKANSLVIADTCGFHARAASTGSNIRVEIWAYSRRNPYYPWTGGDLLSLPGIAQRRINFVWWFRDRFKRWMGQPWRDVGVKKPRDLT